MLEKLLVGRLLLPKRLCMSPLQDIYTVYASYLLAKNVSSQHAMGSEMNELLYTHVGVMSSWDGQLRCLKALNLKED